MQFCIEINMLYLFLLRDFFQSLSGTTDSSIIEATLAQMRDDGLKPDLHTFNFVIYGYVTYQTYQVVKTFENVLTCAEDMSPGICIYCPRGIYRHMYHELLAWSWIPSLSSV